MTSLDSRQKCKMFYTNDTLHCERRKEGVLLRIFNIRYEELKAKFLRISEIKDIYCIKILAGRTIQLYSS